MQSISNVAGSLRTEPNNGLRAISTQQQQPLQHSEVIKVLILLAEARQASVNQSTLTLYARKLSAFRHRDIVAAIDRMLTAERPEGQTAFPPLGFLVSAIKAAAAERQERQAHEARERESQQLRANPSRYVSLKTVEQEVHELRRRRAAGEQIPIPARQWSTADTERYLRALRQENSHVAA